jgi:hypothetical protein
MFRCACRGPSASATGASWSCGGLINRAYTYPDLALPIDATQERLFAAIDGGRSIAEIMQAIGSLSETQARRFVEQLWRYDQVVFDTTRPH